MNYLMKYKTFLPFISNSSFDAEKLSKLLWDLYVEASMKMDEECTRKYDEYWTVGYKLGGSLPIDAVWLENNQRIPEKKELEQIINALTKVIYDQSKTKYSYDVERFYIEEEFPNRLCSLMFVEFD